jgi:predicted transcriptional regulator
MDLGDYQVEEIKRALAEADEQDYATEQEVTQVLKKWSVPSIRTRSVAANPPHEVDEKSRLMA